MIDSLSSKFGCIPTPKEISRLIGGDPSDWGRILKGQQKIAGEYHARLKFLENGIDTAQFELQAAEKSKKYGERTRKGRIVPHTKHIFNDMYNYNLDKMTLEQMKDRNFYDENHEYECYIETGQYIDARGEQYPRTYFEEQTIRRDFLSDLELSS